jgi:hypothetical protein
MSIISNNDMQGFSDLIESSIKQPLASSISPLEEIKIRKAPTLKPNNNPFKRQGSFKLAPERKESMVS